tara:strand:+ start:19606 stop:20475 length:870 start_codon:yes stop_codon:yes gene_type:complete
MIYNKTGNFTTILWDSVTEPEATLKGDWSNPANKTMAGEHWTMKSDFDWLGVSSVKELRSVLTKGYPAGVEKLEKITVGDLPSPQDIRRRRVRSDQGDELDMQAVYRGDLSRAWSRTKRQSRNSVRSVSIVIDLCGSARVTSDELFWRGAAGLRLASELTNAGYSVAIYGAAGSGCYTSEGNENLAQFVEIKAEDSPLDMDRLASLTCLAGFFRTSLFTGIVFAADKQGKKACGSLGAPSNALLAEGIKALPVPQDSIIQPKTVKNQSTAEEWLKSVLEQITNPELKAA